MRVYKVITKYHYASPLLFVVDNLSEVHELYKKHYPESSEIISCELIKVNKWRTK